MSDSNHDIEALLQDLPLDDVPDPAHRAGLREMLYRARVEHVTRNAAQPGLAARAGALLRRRTGRLATALAAAVVAALGVGLLTRSPDGAGVAWGMENAIAALQDVRTIHINGLTKSGAPFDCWVKAGDDRSGSDSLRYETDSEVVVMRDNVTYVYLPKRNEVRMMEGRLLQGVRVWQLALRLRLWVGDNLLGELMAHADRWEVSRRRDEQTGRNAVFVTCDYPRLGMSFWFVFDPATQLIQRARQWHTSERRGRPDYEAIRIAYNERVPDELFAFQIPKGAKVIDASGTEDRRSLLHEAERLYENRELPSAIAVYRQVYQQYPEWSYAAHALTMIGICHRLSGQDDKATDSLERTVQEYPDLRGWSETAWFYLGRQYAESGRKTNAIEAFGKCVALCQGVREPGKFPWKAAREAVEKLTGPP